MCHYGESTCADTHQAHHDAPTAVTSGGVEPTDGPTLPWARPVPRVASSRQTTTGKRALTNILSSTAGISATSSIVTPGALLPSMADCLTQVGADSVP